MHSIKFGVVAVLLAGLFLVTPWPKAHAETFTGTDIESRVIMGLDADTEAVQELMPEGWTSVPYPNGPLKGANLLISFVDGVLMVDAEGKPVAPASRRAIIFLGLGKEDGGGATRIYVMRVYTSEPENDPYQVNVSADIIRMNSLTGPADGRRQIADMWTMNVAGGELAMSLNYTTGNRSWSAGEALSYSSTNPDFYRIYRYDSVTDLVMSSAIGKPITGEYSMTNSVPELADIFDGSQEIIAILDIPVRLRKVFLP